MTSLSGTVSTPFQPPGSGGRKHFLFRDRTGDGGRDRVEKNGWRAHCWKREPESERAREKRNVFSETRGCLHKSTVVLWRHSDFISQ